MLLSRAAKVTAIARAQIKLISGLEHYFRRVDRQYHHATCIRAMYGRGRSLVRSNHISAYCKLQSDLIQDDILVSWLEMGTM
jgi:hypothetical protein